MAHMIPPSPPPPGPGYKAERLIYEALRNQLSEEFFVYNRLKFVEPGRVKEGEADFLVVNREKGMLAIECKGGGVRRKGSGQWVRAVDGEEEPLGESPFDQAQRTIKTLKKQLAPRLKSMFTRLRRFPFVHGHAVAFPMALGDEANLPLDVPREILWDASDLERLGERVVETFRFWRKAASGTVPVLEPFEFKKFRKKILHPQLNVVDCLGAAILADEMALVQLSDEQLHVVEGWLDNRQLRVKGGAGTGKTVLAVEAARVLTEQGEDVLLLCFNKALKKYLDASVEDLALESGSVRVDNFHRLCMSAHTARTGEQVAIPSGKEQTKRFWRDEAAGLLFDAVVDGAIERPTALVVDEGQDFAALWWDVLEEMMGGKGQGKLIVFYDPAQTIFDPECHVPDMPTFTLTRNFRNTQRITGAVCELGNLKMKTFERCPEGTEPEVFAQEHPQAARGQVTKLIRELVDKERIQPGRITIITPHTRKNSLFKDMEQIAGFPLASDPLDRERAILHTTIGAFKGLESEVVILADIDPDDDLCDRNSRYVAASRARHRLYVFAKGNWLG